MNLYFDTSALVKLFHDEKGSESLSQFLVSHSQDLIITISDLARVEFQSVIFRRVRQEEIDGSRAESILDDFNRKIDTMAVVPLNRTIVDKAVELLDRFGEKEKLRTLDALQLASAIISQTTIDVDRFVSSDYELNSVAANFFQVFVPE